MAHGGGSREAGSREAAASELATWLRKFWSVVVAVGIALFVLGLVMLFHVVTTTTVLAVIVGLYLIIWGIAHIGESHRSHGSWPSYVLSLVLVVGGIVVVARPRESLHLLAVIVGATLIVAGAVRLGSGMVASEHVSSLDVLLGVASLVIGVMLIAWPGITVWVIGIVVGIRSIVSGVELVVAGLTLRHLVRSG